MDVPRGSHKLADIMVDANMADDRDGALEIIASGTVRINGQPFGMLDPLLNLTQTGLVISIVGGDEVTVTPV